MQWQKIQCENIINAISNQYPNIYCYLWIKYRCIICKISSQKDNSRYQFDRLFDDYINSCYHIIPQTNGYHEHHVVYQKAENVLQDILSFKQNLASVSQSKFRPKPYSEEMLKFLKINQNQQIEIQLTQSFGRDLLVHFAIKYKRRRR